ncbi:MAG: hypothetical protein D6714_07565, partial [Bacteroidetes bacterium]
MKNRPMIRFVVFLWIGKKARAALAAGFFVLPLLLSAQTRVPAARFLKTALTEPELEWADQKSDFLRQADFSLPRFRELEARTETDEFRLRRQEYLLRLRLNGSAERKAQLQYQRAWTDLAEAERRATLHELLTEKYETTVDFWEKEEQIALLLAEKDLLRDQMTLLKKLAAADPDFELEDLLNAEKASFDLDAEILRRTHARDLLARE